MSRLHNPGPGEILDRLTILALKVTYGKLAGIGTAHWTEEQTALADQLWNTPPGAGASRIRGVQWMELAAINAALWQAEDNLRRERDTQAYVSQSVVIAQIAITIQKLNDRRAELVTLINANAGVGRPPDKL